MSECKWDWNIKFLGDTKRNHDTHYYDSAKTFYDWTNRSCRWIYI